MKNKKLYLTLLVLSPVILGYIFALTPTTSADSLLIEAKESYRKALDGHCSVIAAKFTECVTKQNCEPYDTSNEWFMSEDGYGQPPEVACRRPNLG